MLNAANRAALRLWKEESGVVLALTVIVFLNDDLGDAVYTGEVTGDTIDMEGVIEGDTPFTITLTKG